MDRIGPVLFFILYMVISAWAKQKKAQRKLPPKDMETTESQEGLTETVPAGESILDKLKREFLEVREEVPYVEEMVPVSPPEVENSKVKKDSESHFTEGSDIFSEPIKLNAISSQDENVSESLKDILESYSMVQQGIVLREILGKPRALQDNDEWYYFG